VAVDAVLEMIFRAAAKLPDCLGDDGRSHCLADGTTRSAASVVATGKSPRRPLRRPTVRLTTVFQILEGAAAIEATRRDRNRFLVEPCDPPREGVNLPGPCAPPDERLCRLLVIGRAYGSTVASSLAAARRPAGLTGEK
jgi:hypothetical protein